MLLSVPIRKNLRQSLPLPKYHGSGSNVPEYSSPVLFSFRIASCISFVVIFPVPFRIVMVVMRSASVWSVFDVPSRRDVRHLHPKALLNPKPQKTTVFPFRNRCIDGF